MYSHNGRRCIPVRARTAFVAFLLFGLHSVSWSQDIEHATTPGPSGETKAPEEWIDHLHNGMHSIIWRSAMGIDQMFGTKFDEQTYQQRARGSITPALLWDEFNGLDPKFRFNVQIPLLNLDERYNAFIGRVDRDEFVTERELQSGALPHRQGQGEEDQTLVGIRYREPDRGGRFEADVGLRLRSPVDPFVKGGYRFERTIAGDVLLRLRETAFWQSSEQLGLTSRIDLEGSGTDTWIVRWTASGTISQRSKGVRGYTSLTGFRSLPNQRAIGAQLFNSFELDAPVPVGDYGLKLAYRQRVWRDWLVLEVRPSITWPKTDPDQSRQLSLGFGVGFEMFFGVNEFQARPATF